MESLPVGWTLHACDPEGDGAGPLLRGADLDVCDLFHEDAQVGRDDWWGSKGWEQGRWKKAKRQVYVFY